VICSVCGGHHNAVQELWYWPAERPLNVSRRSVAEHFIGEFIELRLPQASRFMLSASKQLRHPAAKQPGLVRC
jgi:hypothetical protein